MEEVGFQRLPISNQYNTNEKTETMFSIITKRWHSIMDSSKSIFIGPDGKNMHIPGTLVKIPHKTL